MLASNRPGCFSSPLCYREKIDPCISCQFTDQCKKESAARAERLKVRFNIHLISTKTNLSTKRQISGSVCATTGSLIPNKKAQEFIERFERKGINLPESVKAGVNPFINTTPAFMRIGVNVLLSGLLRRDTLKQALMTELGWSESSSASHVGIIVNILLGSGAATETNGLLLPVTVQLEAV